MGEKRKKQSGLEEWFNTVSHALTALTAIGGLVVLIVLGARSNQSFSLFSALFYGISLVILYTFSSLYHGIQHERTKDFFNLLDHCSIYLLIAGTYTPIVLMVLGGSIGWVFFGIQWGLALLGIVLKIFFMGRFETLSVSMYAVMGWIILIKINSLQVLLPGAGFWLLISGGFAYTVGIIFYIIDTRLHLSHFIWHLFVIAGSLLHYLLIVIYVY